MNKALFLTLLVGAASAVEPFGDQTLEDGNQLISRKQSANILQSDWLNLDYAVEADVNYKASPSAIKLLRVL